MANKKEDLLKYFDKSDDVKKEVIVEEGKQLIRENGYQWKLGDHDDLHGRDWVNAVHVEFHKNMENMQSRRSGLRPEAYDEFKNKLASRVNNELTSIKSRNVTCQLSHAEFKKFEALKRKLKASSNGECLSLILSLREEIKKIEKQVFSIAQQVARDSKASYVWNLKKDHRKVKEYIDQLAKYEVLIGDIGEKKFSTEQEELLSEKRQELYKKVPRIELARKPEPKKAKVELSVILKANEKVEKNAEATSQVNESETSKTEELVTIQLPKKELENIYKTLGALVSQASNLESNDAFIAIEEKLKAQD